MRTLIRVAVAAAFAALTASAAFAACPPDPSDPFAPEAVMRRGPYKGRCLDTHEQRSLRVLTPAEAGAGGLAPRPGHVVVANVRHDERFWLAELDPAAVTDVIVQLEYFPAVVPAAHCELRFRFAPGAEALLTPQALGAPRDSVRLEDLVYSVEAVSVVGGDTYDLWRGLWDHYGNAYRLCSLDDRYRDMVTRAGHKVEQVRLRLSPAERTRVLEAALRRGNKAQMRTTYNTLTRNCATEMFNALDGGKRYDLGRATLRTLVTPLVTFPTQARLALRARGLADGTLLPDLAAERGAPAGDRAIGGTPSMGLPADGAATTGAGTPRSSDSR